MRLVEVRYPLVLVLPLRQRTIASLHAKTIAKVGYGLVALLIVTAQVEVGQAFGKTGCEGD